MNLILYITIFLIGIMFGSFYTLATYRIPKKQDITHTHSYCPNCNSKLGFFELIPILSYIFLGGKCKHCKEKISPRYIIFEALSGLTFLLFALAINLNINSTISNFIYYVFIALYLTFAFLTAGIDKEKNKIEKSVLIYGAIISILYMVYLYIIEHVSIYRYIIYLILFFVILVLEYFASKKSKKITYTSYVLMLLTIMAIFTGEYVTITAIIVTLISIAMSLLVYKLKNKIAKKEEKISDNISIGYLLCISNIIMFLLVTFLIS
jgi:leader peptidase (prepilin peptidase)/N-methyltransferase